MLTFEGSDAAVDALLPLPLVLDLFLHGRE